MANAVVEFWCAVVAGTGLACEDPAPQVPIEPPKLDQRLYDVRKPVVEKPKPRKPARLVASGDVAFGKVQVGKGLSTRNIVEVRNDGEVEVGISVTEVIGTESFTRTSGCEPGTLLASGESCSVTIIFRPLTAGIKSGTLLVSGGNLAARTKLTGIALAPPTPKPKPPVVVDKPAAPPPAPKVVIRRPPPGPSREQVYRVSEALSSLDDVAGSDVVILQEPSEGFGFSGDTLKTPTSPDVPRLTEIRYPGDRATGSFDGAVSTLPLERCRIIHSVKPIQVVLDVTIKTQIGGRFIAHAAQDTYGEDGRLVLIPGGTTFEGNYEPLAKQGDTRVQASFSRMIRPDGATIDITDTQAFDLAGSVGLVGEIDNRFIEQFGTVFAATGISALVAIATSDSSTDGTSELQAAGDSINQSLAQVAADALRNGVNLAPRAEVAKGSIATIYPATDWYFPEPATLTQLTTKERKMSFDCSKPLFTPSRGVQQNKESRG